MKMDPPLCDQIYFTGYLPASKDKSLQVFEQATDGNLIFSKQFVKLWFYLSNLGTFQNLGGFKNSNVPSPQVNVTNLTTVGYLTDPTSVARLVVMEADQLNGPIVEADFLLTTFSADLILKVEWEVLDLDEENDIAGGFVRGFANDMKCKTTPIRIGFYTSDDVDFNRTGNLQLIPGSKGPSIFTTAIGSFKCTAVSRIFVAIDREVRVNIRVTSRTPDFIFFPNVTFDNPYTKYLTIFPKKNNCNSIRLGVYTLRATTPVADEIIKEPTPMFMQTAALINAFLEATSLTLILFPDTVPSITQVASYSNLPSFITTSALTLTFDVISILTNGLPAAERQGQYNGNWIGIGLVPVNERPSNTYPAITCNITITNAATIPIRPLVNCQLVTRPNFTIIHPRLDPVTKQPIGRSQEQLTPVQPGQSVTYPPFTFVIPPAAANINISTYIYESVDASLVTVAYNLITIDYIT